MNFTKEIKLEILSKKRNIDDASEFLRGYIYILNALLIMILLSLESMINLPKALF